MLSLDPATLGRLNTKSLQEKMEQKAQLLVRRFTWQRGVVVSGVGLINEVNRHWAGLVLGWVTVRRRVNHLGM